jgi:tRNA (adenine37-N6)-methyltransferase
VPINEILLTPIGEIRTPFETLEAMPIQPAGAAGVEGQVVLAPQFAGGLADLEGFSHIILIYQFHRSKGFQLTVTPFLDDLPRGLFATRAPRRPNPIGLSVVGLKGRDGNVLHVYGIDVLDGTPLLDIKPYVPAFDAPPATRVGWMEGKLEALAQKRSDDRFKEGPA